jgi:signal transduction histidine kinase/ActR/RegA family two-component response regulator
MNPSAAKPGNRILIIDDNLLIHSDFRKILCPEPGSDAALNRTKTLMFGESPAVSPQFVFLMDSAYQGQEGLELVKRAAAAGTPYALAFVDVRMPPGWDGVETIRHLWECCPDLQIVVCTAYSDYSWEEMIRQLGHSPNLVVLKKPFDNIEALQLAHALTEKWLLNRQVQSQLDNLEALVRRRTAELETANTNLKREIVARKKTETGLQLSEERFSKAFHAVPFPLAIQSQQPEIIIDANESFLALLGRKGSDRSQVIGHTPAELGLWTDPRLAEFIRQAVQENAPVRNHSCPLRTLAGAERQVLLSVEPFELGAGPHWLLMLQDITNQMKLESQLRYSQKMEAVGQLAAGVAHDFNNILTIIHGNASLLQHQLPPDPDSVESVNDIIVAADRAARLVRQLLAFSRKQRLASEVLHLGQVVNDLDEMLIRLLGETITLKVKTVPNLPPVYADLSMMEQVIMNLSSNARDAMPKGGTMTIGMDVVTITPDEAQKTPEIRPGAYVCLSVADTGCGIAPELLPRIFDPFFSTKGVGQGTGLGLATVYGIIRQHHGWVDVQSTVNQGTTFRIFLPVCDEKLHPQALSPAPATTVQKGTECVLVVEDEDRVRVLTVAVLRTNGYRVLEAASGKDALDVFRGHSAEINLLFTDVMMPGNLLGDELAARLRTAKPSLAVLFTSGYTPEVNRTEFGVSGNFLTKPFTPSQMLTAVRQCLDHPGNPKN